jgi:hypothetical protein
MITKGARCAHEIKARITRAKAAFRKKAPFTNKLGLNLRKELRKF